MDNFEKVFPEVIDSTMITSFNACNKKHYWSQILGLRREGGSVHLIAGAAFARGVEVVRKAYYGEGIDIDTAVMLGVIAAWIEYDDFEPPEKSYKTPERVAYAIADYFGEYDLADDILKPMMDDNKQPAVEFSFVLPMDVLHPITGNPLLFGGRFDMVAEFQSQLWAEDEKTASRLGPSWIKSFTLRGQLIGYTYAAQQYGLPVNGFIVRGVSFLSKGYGHEQVIEVVPNYRLEQWWEFANNTAKQMVEAWKKDYYQFSFGDACSNYGGCPYQVLCEKHNPENWIGQYFEVDRWEPIKLLEHERKSSKKILEAN